MSVEPTTPKPDDTKLPDEIAALRLICRCFGIAGKDLQSTMDALRETTQNPSEDFPSALWRPTIARAENPTAVWHEVVQSLRQNAVYGAIRRPGGIPVFSAVGSLADSLVFGLLRLYGELRSKLDLGGMSETEALWILVENVFLPTALLELAEIWQKGLGNELRLDCIWYLPRPDEGKGTGKPIPRVLDAWLRVVGYRTAHGISRKMQEKVASEKRKAPSDDSLQKNLRCWLNGDKIKDFHPLHALVDDFATELLWLDDPDQWKVRFTVAWAAQELCEIMDGVFRKLRPDSSLMLQPLLLKMGKEGIVCDDDRILAQPRTFFAARLLQLRLEREKTWETTVLASMPKNQTFSFPRETSDEEIAKAREKFDWELNPGNWFLAYIKNQAPSESTVSLEDRIFALGIEELNRLFRSKVAGGPGVPRP